MQFYSIHTRRHGLDLDSDFAVIKEGFSWPAFFFNSLWALWHRNWIAFFVMVMILVFITFSSNLAGVTPVVYFVLYVGVFMGFGVLANDLRRSQLDRAGFAEVGVAFGDSADQALYFYLKNNSFEP